MPIKCITFDLDDTLWAIHPVIHRAEQHFYQWVKENLPRITETYDAEELSAHRYNYFTQYPELHFDLSGLRRKWMNELAQENGYSEQSIEGGFNVFWTQRNQVDLFEDAKSILDTLKQDFKIGAITNGNADIETIGLAEQFDFVLTSAMAGYSKPHEKIWHYAFDMAGCEASEIIHVGDDPIRDIEGALNMGMKTIWANIFERQWQDEFLPDGEIVRLIELPEVVSKLAAAK